MCATPVARAGGIVECVDARGVTVLSSATSGFACANPRSTVRSPVRGGSVSPLRAATPSDFPVVTVATQQARDSDRVRILRDELATEEGRLAALESAPAPRAVEPQVAAMATRWPAGASTAAVAEQLARTRENIRALQRELSGSR